MQSRLDDEAKTNHNVKRMNASTAPVISDGIREVATRLFWWMPPEQAVQDTTRFLAQVMALGTWNDVAATMREYPEAQWKETLRNAPPGVIDPRSWHYWHVKFGITPVPPMPVRKL
jgi:hypothetical protein